MKTIQEFIAQKNWILIVTNYSVKDVCMSLNFSEAMHLVKHLFYDDIQDDVKQQYALKLAFEIKNYFVSEWANDWKNEVFLGGLCAMLWLYDARYLCYKRAYDKLEDPPVELLLLLSYCNDAPGSPPISDEESKFYFEKALTKKMTTDTAVIKKGGFNYNDDKSQKELREQMCRKLEGDGVSSEMLMPDVFRK